MALALAQLWSTEHSPLPTPCPRAEAGLSPTNSDLRGRSASSPKPFCRLARADCGRDLSRGEPISANLAISLWMALVSLLNLLMFSAAATWSGLGLGLTRVG